MNARAALRNPPAGLGVVPGKRHHDHRHARFKGGHHGARTADCHHRRKPLEQRCQRNPLRYVNVRRQGLNTQVERSGIAMLSRGQDHLHREAGQPLRDRSQHDWFELHGAFAGIDDGLAGRQTGNPLRQRLRFRSFPQTRADVMHRGRQVVALVIEFRAAGNQVEGHPTGKIGDRAV